MTSDFDLKGKARELRVKNHIIIVDADDYGFLSKLKWSIKKDKNTFYAQTNMFLSGKNTSVSMHRLITGCRKMSIDHKNRNGLDNRRENLRFCTAKQNSYNRIRPNKFGYRGVYMPKRSPRYSFQIQINGKKYSKHGFATPQDAAKAYDKLNKELHGEFGIRNFED